MFKQFVKRVGIFVAVILAIAFILEHSDLSELKEQGAKLSEVVKSKLTGETTPHYDWSDLSTREAGVCNVLTLDEVEYAFVWVPPGEYVVGSPESEPGRHSDETLHKARISRGYWILATETPQSLWRSATGENPCKIQGAELPVVDVSYDDVQKIFLKRLNELQPIPDGEFRLPTEAEWEIAARAGAPGEYDEQSLSIYAWNADNSGDKIHAVAQKKANPWGIYDMLGNASEWVADWYGPYSESEEAVESPTGPESGGARVVKGGDYTWGPLVCRPAFRGEGAPAARSKNLGFRPVFVPMTAEEKKAEKK